ncbi:uncharacterized protein BXZ73DRAFT_101305 [Epithele typhae]|uniref:uncharacterized protein n=1 Tax=Epithele typhae TaxID=378194 RepID=UPI0020083B2D|nr:uncharacterized protein BXZ73DRAFT_101305 [Epithele typhae]KAH9932767.1 hypothetical protein BXZ73DRAFT_101305 [Epithele typhae]
MPSLHDFTDIANTTTTNTVPVETNTPLTPKDIGSIVGGVVIFLAAISLVHILAYSRLRARVLDLAGTVHAHLDACARHFALPRGEGRGDTRAIGSTTTKFRVPPAKAASDLKDTLISPGEVSPLTGLG